MIRRRRKAVKKRGRKTAGAMPCVLRMRNGVLLFDQKTGARETGMALVNRLRDEE